MAAASNPPRPLPLTDTVPTLASRDRNNISATNVLHPHTSRSRHSNNPSISSQRSSSGLLAFFDRTLTGITEAKLRQHQLNGRVSTGSDLLPSVRPSSTILPSDPPSKPYTETDPSFPKPIRAPRYDSKMHQTSSRLLRMTDDDRPFTKVRSSQLPTLASREEKGVQGCQESPKGWRHGGIDRGISCGTKRC